MDSTFSLNSRPKKNPPVNLRQTKIQDAFKPSKRISGNKKSSPKTKTVDADYVDESDEEDQLAPAIEVLPSPPKNSRKVTDVGRMNEREVLQRLDIERVALVERLKLHGYVFANPNVIRLTNGSI